MQAWCDWALLARVVSENRIRDRSVLKLGASRNRHLVFGEHKRKACEGAAARWAKPGCGWHHRTVSRWARGTAETLRHRASRNKEYRR